VAATGGKTEVRHDAAVSAKHIGARGAQVLGGDTDPGGRIERHLQALFQVVLLGSRGERGKAHNHGEGENRPAVTHLDTIPLASKQ